MKYLAAAGLNILFFVLLLVGLRALFAWAWGFSNDSILFSVALAGLVNNLYKVFQEYRLSLHS
jgi:hypothetical protein